MLKLSAFILSCLYCCPRVFPLVLLSVSFLSSHLLHMAETHDESLTSEAPPPITAPDQDSSSPPSSSSLQAVDPAALLSGLTLQIEVLRNLVSAQSARIDKLERTVFPSPRDPSFSARKGPDPLSFSPPPAGKPSSDSPHILAYDSGYFAGLKDAGKGKTVHHFLANRHDPSSGKSMPPRSSSHSSLRPSPSSSSHSSPSPLPPHLTLPDPTRYPADAKHAWCALHLKRRGRKNLAEVRPGLFVCIDQCQ